MSKELEQSSQPSDQMIALYLQENDSERLTDILVDALFKALRILEDDVTPDVLH
jgi:hypothetical protein